jgi:hypothetical protein
MMRVSIVTVAAWTLLASLGCGKDEVNSTDNDPAARDAAPGQLSEASPPSVSENDSTRSEPSPDTADKQPQQ